MRRVMRTLIQALTASFALAMSLVVLAWLVGRFTTDEWSWSQYLWWIPTPIALMAGLVLVLTLLLRRAIKGAWWPVVSSLAMLLLMAAYFAFVEQRMHRSAPEQPEGVLIMHWNWTHSVPHNVEGHVDQILAVNPDIGVMTDWQRLTRRAEQRQRLEPTWHVTGVSSFTVLSRYPILRARPLVSNDTTQIALVEIDASPALGRPIVLWLCDLPSELEIGRMEHMRELRDMLDDSGETLPDVALGDFNVTRGSASLKALLPGMRHAFDDAGHGYAATYYRPYPLYHIDNMLIDASLRATEYAIIDPGFGRHRAQTARITATSVAP